MYIAWNQISQHFGRGARSRAIVDDLSQLMDFHTCKPDRSGDCALTLKRILISIHSPIIASLVD